MFFTITFDSSSFIILFHYVLFHSIWLCFYSIWFCMIPFDSVSLCENWFLAFFWQLGLLLVNNNPNSLYISNHHPNSVKHWIFKTNLFGLCVKLLYLGIKIDGRGSHGLKYWIVYRAVCFTAWKLVKKINIALHSGRFWN